MKKAIGSLLMLLALAASGLAQQGAEALINDGAAYLAAFFKNRFDIRVAIVRFENDSELGDTAMQKIYQMLISKLENEKNIRVADLLVNFAGGQGEFNLSQAGDLDFLLDLKLIQNKSRTGLGLTIFSRLQDRVVAVKYFEKPLAPGEMDWLNTRSPAFSGLGFSLQLEFESKKNLMDIQSIPAEGGGREQYFFYYPDEIIVYRANGTRLEKSYQFKLKWTRPFFPVLHYEGRLLLFHSTQSLLMTAGNNFSPTAQVLAFRDGQWQEIRKVDFVPLRYIEMNQIPYLAGARYEEGRNFFKDKVYLLPFRDSSEQTVVYVKKIVPAMALDLSVQGGQFQALHLIDRDYGYHLYTAEFEEKTPLREKKGASLAALDGEWLAVSDHSRSTDLLFFYDIRDGGEKLVYTAKIPGEVQFLSAGTWQNAKGFWAGVRQSADGLERLQVQFWGKRDE
jgi:hypothetical protein